MINRINRLFKNFKRHCYKPEDKGRLDNFRKECQEAVENARLSYLTNLGKKLHHPCIPRYHYVLLCCTYDVILVRLLFICTRS